MKFDAFTSTKSYGHVAFNRTMESSIRAAVFFIASLVIIGVF